MEHEKQVEVVKQALELETQIQVLEQFLPEERAETYAEPEPQPPVRQEAHYTEPPIRHGCKVNWLLMLGPAGITLALSAFSNSAFLVWMFALTLFVWVPVYYFALYRKQKAATIERIRNSAEYQQQCTAARMATNRQQLDFDEAYTKAKEEYDSVLLPRYQAARSAWEAEHQAQIRKEEQELAQAKKELAALYGETRIVPAQYRRVDALQYIYDMISTSDYDVRQAIEYFDKSQQRALEEMRLQGAAAGQRPGHGAERPAGSAELHCGESPAGRQHRCGSGRRAAAQYQQGHQKMDGEISSGGRYITCRRMRFIGAGRSLSRARFPKALFQRPDPYGAFRTDAP